MAAAHAFDKSQDSDSHLYLNVGIFALGAASLAILELDVGLDVRNDIAEALAHMILSGANAQQKELEMGRKWNSQEYFSCIAAKTATIVASGIWIGGRLIMDEIHTLDQLRSFGLAIGFSLQLSDDLRDIAEDLANNTWTLPVLLGIQQIEHAFNKELTYLLDQAEYSTEDIVRIIKILRAMGIRDIVQKLIVFYRIQARVFYESIPTLDSNFASYVSI